MTKLRFRLRSLANNVARLAFGREGGVKYWERRAREYGRRAVLNIGHSESEFESVTKLQESELFPYFRSQLTGAERLALDFGCGPGRFTRQIADMIKGRALGVDPIKSLLDLAPKGRDVSYQLLRRGEIPAATGSVDVVWCCLVLGGIPGKELARAATEIDRVLVDRGLLFLVENTTLDRPSAAHWAYRSIEDYSLLFPSVRLSELHEYHDLGERISVFAGRKLMQSNVLE